MQIMGKIAIESSLTPIRDYLVRRGYQVENVNPGASSNVNLNLYDAFILTGMSSNFMGDQKTQTKAAVIDASGMTPEDVYNALKQRVTAPDRNLKL